MKNRSIHHQKFQLTTIMLLICLVFLPVSCKKKDPGPNEVFMNDDKFTPSTITISPGTTITWVNKEKTVHTVTSSQGIFDSGDLSKGKSFSYHFTDIGEYNYYCKHHSGMIGKVVVN